MERALIAWKTGEYLDYDLAQDGRRIPNHFNDARYGKSARTWRQKSTQMSEELWDEIISEASEFAGAIDPVEDEIIDSQPDPRSLVVFR